MVARLLVVLSLLIVAAVVVWVVRVVTASDTDARSPAAGVEPAAVEPDSAAPIEAVDTGPGAVAPERSAGVETLRAWANKLTGPTGVPARALMAYGNAELVVRTAMPRCGLSWATLAGIGRVESDHGRYGGAVLGADGRPSIPIIGVPLDGSPGVRAIADTDRGELDGDAAADRAVGPMQFIPSTWRKWGADGNGDGVADPQQIDDAALAAGRYLCAQGRDLTSAKGWWGAVFSYNNSVEYGQKVFGLADEYARRAAARG